MKKNFGVVKRFPQVDLSYQTGSSVDGIRVWEERIADRVDPAYLNIVDVILRQIEGSCSVLVKVVLRSSGFDNLVIILKNQT